MRDNTNKHPDQAILVGVLLPGESSDVLTEHLDELEALTATMGAEVCERIVQERPRIDPSTFIGKGKADEVKAAALAHGAAAVIFDVELSPAQKKNLEKILPEEVAVLDRSTVILQIFARHARTHEARTQVELARLEYELPRLTSRWTHLHRQRGGIGLRGGEGETQLEVDRRMTQKRIARLKQELEKIALQRQVRSRSRSDVFKIALVGYTNAGKSSIMNALTGAGVLVQNQLFSTLDSTIRAWEPKDGPRMVLIDTVGFIRKLPHQLVASFRSTLEEAAEADLLLIVVDVSNPRAEEHLETTERVLGEMRLVDRPRLLVLNKADRLEEEGRRDRFAALYPEAIFASAHSGEGLDSLKDAVLHHYRQRYVEEKITLSSGDGKAVALVHDRLEVLETAYTDGIVCMRVRGTPEELSRIRQIAADSLRATG